MTFTYTYRSSDGQRHSAEIEAESRDAVFAKVRSELGIKPIKVTAVEGDRPIAEGNGRSAASARRHAHLIITLTATIALFILAAWWFVGRGGRDAAPALVSEERHGYRQETREAILKLIERAGALEDRCRAELTLLKLDRLHDYAWIAGERDLSPLYREIEKAQSIIDYTRAQAKELFRDVYRQFPATCVNERTDAQRRYGELMESLDAEEERQQAAHLALMLVDDHRSAWRVKGGRIVFTDPKVEEEFRFYTMPTDGSAARWKRDFGKEGVSTP